MAYNATKHPVHNRGVPPDNFLNELVAWGKVAPDEIFAPNAATDVYSNVFRVLGPWQGPRPSPRRHVGSDASARRL